jgi:nucleotide-binding universal stress UspA family protein
MPANPARVARLALHQGLACRSAYATNRYETRTSSSSNLERPIMKTLLAVDGSKFTKQMLAYLAGHPELIGTQHHFTVLTVIASLPNEVNRFIERGTIDGYYKEKADEVLQPVVAFANEHGWKVTATHAVGHAADAIAAAAKDGNFDLLVMGSHGHSTLGSLVVGSVVHGVMARCKTPMLIIR